MPRTDNLLFFFAFYRQEASQCTWAGAPLAFAGYSPISRNDGWKFLSGTHHFFCWMY